MQGVPLRVELAAFCVPALANDGAVLHQHGAHQRVGSRPAGAPLGQLHSQAHVIQIFHMQPPNKKGALNGSFKAP